MKPARKIPRDAALAAFEYDPVTGDLRWKDRPWIDPGANARFRGKVAGTKFVTDDGKTYIKVCLDRVQYLAHRVIWTMVNGKIPDGYQIDHGDGDGCRNVWENLDCVPPGVNMKNVRLNARNTSGYAGVRRSGKNGWQATVQVDGKTVCLGSRKSPKEAYDLRAAFNAKNGFHPNHGSDRPL